MSVNVPFMENLFEPNEIWLYRIWATGKAISRDDQINEITKEALYRWLDIESGYTLNIRYTPRFTRAVENTKYKCAQIVLESNCKVRPRKIPQEILHSKDQYILDALDQLGQQSKKSGKALAKRCCTCGSLLKNSVKHKGF